MIAFLIENGKVKNEYDKSYIQEQKQFRGLLTIKYLLQIVKCPNCSNYLNLNNDMIKCFNCSFKKSKNSVIKYVDGKYHSNWGLQWNEFSKIQLDSFNLTDETEKDFSSNLVYILMILKKK